jgi:transcriptional regulatory protein RtcR
MSKEALWPGNFRELSASITRMATLAEAGRLNEEIVAEEIARLRKAWRPAEVRDPLDHLPGRSVTQLDLFDRVQLSAVVDVCRRSSSLSEAGRTLFAASRQEKAKSNDADRIRKYLARFGLDWNAVRIDHAHDRSS